MNRPGQKKIYRDSIIRTANQYDLMRLLTPMEKQKLYDFPEEDVAVIRYLTYFISNNYNVYSKHSRNKKEFIKVRDVIDQACYISLEIKPFHVLVAYACASYHLMKITPLKYALANARLNIIPKEKITHIPFNEDFLKSSFCFSKKQELEFKKIGLKRHVHIKDKLRSAG